ncbi:FAD-dependent oxidoreductase [Brevibacillus brevis]|uniref:FAD-dependent oxidoreductase n=1 Tax=Brevibacillus brevis TaxID=1393 RepID=UPI0025A5A3DE|nr:FAD-dependent oxidoreductase [Brevibacillus brevis]WJQ83079.1 FAD-dependent oxidoreductase [Brevibacillus brevis]
MEKYDVVIVGGGVAGLTTAIYAAKAGKQTIIIEKQDRLGYESEKRGVLQRRRACLV